MKILITGGAGFVGPNLVLKLKEAPPALVKGIKEYKGALKDILK
jgi:nucleoside-diphosphate-sugar epimerase